MLTAVILLTIILIALYILSNGLEKYKSLFGNIATMIQTLAAVWAIWYAVNESAANNEQFKTNLSKQDTLIELQKILLKKQDSTTDLNLKALKTLADTSGRLLENMAKVNMIVSEMPSKIDGVSASFAKLTEYAEEEAELLRLKSSNNAKLYLAGIEIKKEYEDDQTYDIKNIYIGNSGNLQCRIMKIELMLDTLLFYDVFCSVISDNYLYVEKNNDKFVVTFDYSYKILTISGFDKKFKVESDTYVKARMVDKFEGITKFNIFYNIYFFDDNGSRLSDGFFEIKLFQK